MTNELADVHEETKQVSSSGEEEVGEPADTPGLPAAGGTAPVTKPVPALNLNQLQDYSSAELESLARDLHLRLYPARSRHQHILDVVRAALGRGGTVTTEGFLEQGEAMAFLRLPRLNFLALPEDVCVPRALI